MKAIGLSRNVRHGAVVVASVASIGPMLAHGAQLRTMNIGNWSGGSFSDDQTGKFSHCVFTANYKSGINLYVAVNRQWGWNLGFSNPQWQLQPGTQIPVQASFDGRAPYTGTANIVTPVLGMLPMATESKLINDFRRSDQMTVYANGRAFPFILTTTSKVMVALSRCVQAELDFEQGGPAPDLGAVVESLVTVPAARNPKLLNPVGAVPPPVHADSSPDLTLAATQIATNLLLQAKLPNARLLSASETPDDLKGFGVAWASDNGQGAVKIISTAAGQTGQDIASQLIAAEASTCKGDFASGRSSELVDNSIVTKAFVGCRQASGMKSARYLIYQGGPSHFVVFDTVSAATSGRQPSEAPPTETGFQTAALRAVSYQTWK